jgi:hypothetical protein
MNKGKIRDLVYQLDKVIPKDEAEVEFATFGETAMFATENGYLRLGVELMKRAFEGRDDGECIEYLMSESSDFCFDWLETDKEHFDFIKS